MAERPFNEDDLKRFGRFLEVLGTRLRADEDFRRSLVGLPEEVPVDVAEREPGELSVEFHDTQEEILATVVLPPNTRKEDVKLHVSRDEVELVLKGRRLVIVALPEPVIDQKVKATIRNNILDVVMQKERPASGA